MRTWIFWISSSVWLVGCAEEFDTQAALEAIAPVVASAGARSQESVRESTEDVVSVDLSFDCEEGGKVRIVGITATCTDTARQGEFMLTVEIDGCMVGGVELAGTIEHTAVLSDPETGLQAFDVTGTVSLSGDVDGTCELDFHYTNHVVEQQLELTGNLCGSDAADFTAPLLHPWWCPRQAAP